MVGRLDLFLAHDFATLPTAKQTINTWVKVADDACVFSKRMRTHLVNKKLKVSHFVFTLTHSICSAGLANWQAMCKCCRNNVALFYEGRHFLFPLNRVWNNKSHMQRMPFGTLSKQDLHDKSTC